MKYKLSFCIGTYNRSDRVCKLVKTILSNPNKRFNVVVLDNCSSDNTISKLNEIAKSDERLVVASNDYNKGPLYNWFHSFLLSDSEYVFYVNDRDLISPERIDDFIFWLDEQDVSGGICVREKEINQLLNTVNEKMKYIFSGLHPTGIFLKRELLNDINETNICDQSRVGLFPFDFILAEIAQNSPIGIYCGDIWNIAERKYINMVKSKVATANSAQDVWFAPKERILQYERYIEYIYGSKYFHKFNVLLKQKKRLVTDITINFYRFSNDEYLQNHYGYSGVYGKKFVFGEGLSQLIAYRHFDLIPLFLLGCLKMYLKNRRA